MPGNHDGRSAAAGTATDLCAAENRHIGKTGRAACACYWYGLDGYGRLRRAQARQGLPFEALKSRSEEHTSELQSLMRISYAVFCLKKKKINKQKTSRTIISTQNPHN